MNGKCREELPMHKMPYPFKDFDCQRYLILPETNLPPNELSEVLNKALKIASEHTKTLVHCHLTVKAIEKNEDKYKITFGVSFVTKEDEKQSRRLIVTVQYKKKDNN